MTRSSLVRQLVIAATVAATGSMPIGVQAGELTVSFVQPDRFVDADDWDRDARDTIREVARDLRQLGKQYLPPDVTLRIDILDIDLAGMPRVMSAGNDVRVMTGDADWPRIDLRYTLLAGNTVLRSARETIVDHAYLRRVDRQYAPAMSLPYERRMLAEWFASRFGDLKSRPSH